MQFPEENDAREFIRKNSTIAVNIIYKSPMMVENKTPFQPELLVL